MGVSSSASLSSFSSPVQHQQVIELDQPAMPSTSGVLTLTAGTPSRTESGLVQLWDAMTWDLLWSSTYLREYMFIRYCPAHKIFAFDVWNQVLVIWDLYTGLSEKIGGIGSCIGLMPNHSGTRVLIRRSASGDMVRVSMWRIDAGNKAEMFALAPTVKSFVLFTEDDDHIIMITANGRIDLWDAHTGDGIRSLDGFSFAIGVPRISLSRNMFSMAFGREIRVWDLNTGAVVFQYESYSSISAICIQEDYLVAARVNPIEQSTCVTSWNLKDGTHFFTAISSMKYVKTIILDLGAATFFMLSSSDFTIRQYEWRTGKELRCGGQFDRGSYLDIYKPFLGNILL
jgi:hypothetical protein